MVVSESELLSPDFDVRLIPASEASRADADGGGAERKARPASATRRENRLRPDGEEEREFANQCQFSIPGRAKRSLMKEIVLVKASNVFLEPAGPRPGHCVINMIPCCLVVVDSVTRKFFPKIPRK